DLGPHRDPAAGPALGAHGRGRLARRGVRAAARRPRGGLGARRARAEPPRRGRRTARPRRRRPAAGPRAWRRARARGGWGGARRRRRGCGSRPAADADLRPRDRVRHGADRAGVGVAPGAGRLRRGRARRARARGPRARGRRRPSGRARHRAGGGPMTTTAPSRTGRRAAPAPRASGFGAAHLVRRQLAAAPGALVLLAVTALMAALLVTAWPRAVDRLLAEHLATEVGTLSAARLEPSVVALHWAPRHVGLHGAEVLEAEAHDLAAEARAEAGPTLLPALGDVTVTAESTRTPVEKGPRAD